MRRPRLTARARILGLTTLVVAVALAVTVVLLRQVLLSELDERIDRDLAQEAQEFAEVSRLTERGPDQTAEEFARQLLENYMVTNVPADNEVLIAVQNRQPFLESADPPGNIRADVEFLFDVTDPTLGTIDSAAGPVRVLAQPLVDSGQQAGLLVVGFFLDVDRQRISDTIRDAAIVALAALAAAVALAWVVAGRVLRPVQVLADTARDITEHDLSRRIPIQGSDEFAAMVDSFNSMLDRLQRAVDTQRQFLNDAGHELRTPLTVIRGQLEVASLTEDAERSDERTVRPPDATTPIVLREVDRMSRIVDDLLVLARSETVEFVRMAPFDADEFVTNTFELVQQLGDHDWSIDALPIGIVVGDSGRLTQAMLNLAANAARHTADGREISIGGQLDADEFRLWVADSGDGIEPEELQRVFQRFHRATTTRSSGGSAGLGLSIVDAIVRAHGGTVSVESEVGVGSTFTIRIPLHELLPPPVAP
ncbi:MAG: sensor histidine kinase [Ilumatobacter sp.]|uniref:sensor histidine kinase n=1 Tax=Ilumatobacter sp. TaxID=1967498 RepID=UPI00391B5E26